MTGSRPCASDEGQSHRVPMHGATSPHGSRPTGRCSPPLPSWCAPRVSSLSPLPPPSPTLPFLMKHLRTMSPRAKQKVRALWTIRDKAGDSHPHCDTVLRQLPLPACMHSLITRTTSGQPGPCSPPPLCSLPLPYLVHADGLLLVPMLLLMLSNFLLCCMLFVCMASRC